MLTAEQRVVVVSYEFEIFFDSGSVIVMRRDAQLPYEIRLTDARYHCTRKNKRSALTRAISTPHAHVGPVNESKQITQGDDRHIMDIHLSC